MIQWIIYNSCREEGIRTLEAVTRLHAFQACSFNRSDTSLFVDKDFKSTGLILILPLVALLFSDTIIIGKSSLKII